MKEHEYYMQRTLDLAARGLGRTNPNPVVGAVIVKNNQIIGEGFHRRAGTDHAEIVALKEAGEKAQGATMYVSLEPCNHFGRTPPCTRAIIGAGIEKVMIACRDPNPRVEGDGIRELMEAGLQVDVGILQQQAERLNEVFFKYALTGLPFVALKTAITLDGKIATREGDSRWISNDESRKLVHQLRDRYQGIMVGIGTVLADDPMLNTRIDMKEDKRDPVRIIIDGSLQIPPGSKIAATAMQQRTLLFTMQGSCRQKAVQLEKKGLEIISIEGSASSLPLLSIMEICASMGISSILLEGGAEINASMLQAGLIDKVYWFIAPKIVGGNSAPGPVGGAGIARMEDALLLKDIEFSNIDNDILLTGYLRW